MDDKFMASGQVLMTPQTAISSVRPKRIYSAVLNSKPHHLPPIGNQRGAIYRDPAMMQLAPQNIMHDRRICRGNTFAALVIPVSKLYTPNFKLDCFFKTRLYHCF